MSALLFAFLAVSAFATLSNLKATAADAQSSDNFTYKDYTILDVTPKHIPTHGGATLTLRGKGFSSITSTPPTVKVGADSQTCSNPKVINDTTLTCYIEHTTGTYSNSSYNGSSWTSSTSEASILLSSTTPSTSDFYTPGAVQWSKCSGTTAQPVKGTDRASDPLCATAALQTAANSRAKLNSEPFSFSDTYIDYVAASAGSTAGGQLVHIFGNGFNSSATAGSNLRTVKIGGVECTGPTVVSATEVTCTTGALVNAPGTASAIATDTDYLTDVKYWEAGTSTGATPTAAKPNAYTDTNKSSGSQTHTLSTDIARGPVDKTTTISLSGTATTVKLHPSGAADATNDITLTCSTVDGKAQCTIPRLAGDDLANHPAGLYDILVDQNIILNGWNYLPEAPAAVSAPTLKVIPGSTFVNNQPWVDISFPQSTGDLMNYPSTTAQSELSYCVALVSNITNAFSHYTTKTGSAFSGVSDIDARCNPTYDTAWTKFSQVTTTAELSSSDHPAVKDSSNNLHFFFNFTDLNLTSNYSACAGTGNDSAFNLGNACKLAVFVRNDFGNVSAPTNFDLQLHSLKFHSNGDGKTYTPVWETANDAQGVEDPVNSAKGNTLVRYVLDGKSFDTTKGGSSGDFALPAPASLDGWTNQGWCLADSQDNAKPASFLADENDCKDQANYDKALKLGDNITANANYWSAWSWNPQATSLSGTNTKGKAAGGQVVTLQGQGLLPWGKAPDVPSRIPNDSTLKLGDTECTADSSTIIISNTEVTCKVPGFTLSSLSPEYKSFTLSWTGASDSTTAATQTISWGTNDADKYKLEPFVVYSANPAVGSTSGNTPVIINGDGFMPSSALRFDTTSDATGVLLGSSKCLDPQVLSQTQISCLTSSGTAGTVDAKVKFTDAPYYNTTGTYEASQEGAYTYSDQVVSAVSPNVGVSTGGTTLAIHGEGFASNPLPTIHIGTSNTDSAKYAECGSVSFVSSYLLTCVTSDATAKTALIESPLNVYVGSDASDSTPTKTLLKAFTYKASAALVNDIQILKVEPHVVPIGSPSNITLTLSTALTPDSSQTDNNKITFHPIASGVDTSADITCGTVQQESNNTVWKCQSPAINNDTIEAAILASNGLADVVVTNGALTYTAHQGIRFETRGPSVVADPSSKILDTLIQRVQFSFPKAADTYGTSSDTVQYCFVSESSATVDSLTDGECSAGIDSDGQTHASWTTPTNFSAAASGSGLSTSGSVIAADGATPTTTVDSDTLKFNVLWKKNGDTTSPGVPLDPSGNLKVAVFAKNTLGNITKVAELNAIPRTITYHINRAALTLNATDASAVSTPNLPTTSAASGEINNGLAFTTEQGTTDDATPANNTYYNKRQFVLSGGKLGDSEVHDAPFGSPTAKGFSPVREVTDGYTTKNVNWFTGTFCSAAVSSGDTTDAATVPGGYNTGSTCSTAFTDNTTISADTTVHQFWQPRLVEFEFICSTAASDPCAANADGGSTTITLGNNSISETPLTSVYPLTTNTTTGQTTRDGYSLLGWAHTSQIRLASNQTEANATNMVTTTADSAKIADSFTYIVDPSDATSAADSGKMKLTLYPIWKAKQVTITYCLNDSTDYSKWTGSGAADDDTNCNGFKTGSTQASVYSTGTTAVAIPEKVDFDSSMSVSGTETGYGKTWGGLKTLHSAVRPGYTSLGWHAATGNGTGLVDAATTATTVMNTANNVANASDDPTLKLVAKYQGLKSLIKFSASKPSFCADSALQDPVDLNWTIDSAAEGNDIHKLPAGLTCAGANFEGWKVKSIDGWAGSAPSSSVPGIHGGINISETFSAEHEFTAYIPYTGKTFDTDLTTPEAYNDGSKPVMFEAQWEAVDYNVGIHVTRGAGTVGSNGEDLGSFAFICDAVGDGDAAVCKNGTLINVPDPSNVGPVATATSAATTTTPYLSFSPYSHPAGTPTAASMHPSWTPTVAESYNPTPSVNPTWDPTPTLATANADTDPKVQQDIVFPIVKKGNVGDKFIVFSCAASGAIGNVASLTDSTGELVSSQTTGGCANGKKYVLTIKGAGDVMASAVFVPQGWSTYPLTEQDWDTPTPAESTDAARLIRGQDGIAPSPSASADVSDLKMSNAKLTTNRALRARSAIEIAATPIPTTIDEYYDGGYSSGTTGLLGSVTLNPGYQVRKWEVETCANPAKQTAIPTPSGSPAVVTDHTALCTSSPSSWTSEYSLDIPQASPVPTGSPTPIPTVSASAGFTAEHVATSDSDQLKITSGAPAANLRFRATVGPKADNSIRFKTAAEGADWKCGSSCSGSAGQNGAPPAALTGLQTNATVSVPQYSPSATESAGFVFKGFKVVSDSYIYNGETPATIKGAIYKRDGSTGNDYSTGTYCTEASPCGEFKHMPVGEVVLEPVWGPANYGVKYLLNTPSTYLTTSNDSVAGDSDYYIGKNSKLCSNPNAANPSDCVTFGATLSAPTGTGVTDGAPKLTGYDFKGWYIGTNYNDVSYAASSETAASSAKPCSNISVGADGTVPGATRFWHASESGVSSATAMPASDLVLCAAWSPVKSALKVRNNGHGTLPSSITLPESTSAMGQKIAEITVTDSDTDAGIFDAQVPFGTPLTAFDSRTYASTTPDAKTNIKMQSFGYVFGGWYQKGDSDTADCESAEPGTTDTCAGADKFTWASESTDALPIMPATAKNMKAKWTVATVNVNYCANAKTENGKIVTSSQAQDSTNCTSPTNGSTDATVTTDKVDNSLNYGKAIVASGTSADNQAHLPSDPTRTGYTFSGWKAGTAASSVSAITNGVAITAGLTLLNKDLGVTLGLDNYNNVKKCHGDSLPADNAVEVNCNDISTNPLKVSVYATWAPQKRFVKFDSAKNINASAASVGGSAPSIGGAALDATTPVQEFTFDTSANLAQNNWTLEGWDFLGWCSADQHAQDMDSSAVLDSDTGCKKNSQSSAVSFADKASYTFNGTNDGTDSGAGSSNKGNTLHALWKPKSVTVTYKQVDPSVGTVASSDVTPSTTAPTVDYDHYFSAAPSFASGSPTVATGETLCSGGKTWSTSSTLQHLAWENSGTISEDTDCSQAVSSFKPDISTSSGTQATTTNGVVLNNGSPTLTLYPVAYINKYTLSAAAMQHGESYTVTATSSDTDNTSAPDYSGSPTVNATLRSRTVKMTNLPAGYTVSGWTLSNTSSGTGYDCTVRGGGVTQSLSFDKKTASFSNLPAGNCTATPTFTADKQTVTFNDGTPSGATALTPPTVSDGDKPSTGSVFKIPTSNEETTGYFGYKFSGWKVTTDASNTILNKFYKYDTNCADTAGTNTGDSLANANCNFTTPGNEVTLTAQWEPQVVQVDLCANDGSNSENCGQTASGSTTATTTGATLTSGTSLKYGNALSTLSAWSSSLPTFTDISRKGYDFSGWFKTASPEPSATEVTNSVSINLTDFTNSEITYTAGSASENFNDASAYKLKLYAKWTPKTITVTYKPRPDAFTTSGTYLECISANTNNCSSASAGNQDATPTSTDSFTFDKEQAAQANGFKLAGYTFLGWCAGDVTDNGTENLTYDTACGESNRLTSNKFTFKTSFPIGGVASFNGVWAKQTLPTMTYNANGGTGNMGAFTCPVASPTGCTTSVRSPVFTPPSGFNFKEWNTAANGSGSSVKPGDSVAVGSAVCETGKTCTATNVSQLFAIWTRTLQLTYNANGGQGAMAPETCQEIWAQALAGCSVTVKTMSGMSKPGYTFDKWSSDASEGEDVATGSKTITANTTIYAQWQPIDNLTLTIQITNEGNSVTGAKVDYCVDYASVQPTTECTVNSSGSVHGSFTGTGGSINALHPGDTVKLQAGATAAAGWGTNFSWDGRAGTGTDSQSTSFTMPATNKTVNAAFTLLHFGMRHQAPAHFHFVSAPARFNYGQEISVTGETDFGYKVTGWSCKVVDSGQNETTSNCAGSPTGSGSGEGWTWAWTANVTNNDWGVQLTPTVAPNSVSVQQYKGLDSNGNYLDGALGDQGANTVSATVGQSIDVSSWGNPSALSSPTLAFPYEFKGWRIQGRTDAPSLTAIEVPASADNSTLNIVAVFEGVTVEEPDDSSVLEKHQTITRHLRVYTVDQNGVQIPGNICQGSNACGPLDVEVKFNEKSTRAFGTDSWGDWTLESVEPSTLEWPSVPTIDYSLVFANIQTDAEHPYKIQGMGSNFFDAATGGTEQTSVPAITSTWDSENVFYVHYTKIEECAFNELLGAQYWADNFDCRMPENKAPVGTSDQGDTPVVQVDVKVKLSTNVEETAQVGKDKTAQACSTDSADCKVATLLTGQRAVAKLSSTKGFNPNELLHFYLQSNEFETCATTSESAAFALQDSGSCAPNTLTANSEGSIEAFIPIDTATAGPAIYSGTNFLDIGDHTISVIGSTHIAKANFKIQAFSAGLGAGKGGTCSISGYSTPVTNYGGIDVTNEANCTSAQIAGTFNPAGTTPATPPSAPINLTASGTSNTTARASWTASAPGTIEGGAAATVKYQVVVDSNSGDPGSFTNGTTCASGLETTSTAVQCSGLTRSMQYYIHVRAANSAGLFSAWTTATFTTMDVDGSKVVGVEFDTTKITGTVGCGAGVSADICVPNGGTITLPGGSIIKRKGDGTTESIGGEFMVYSSNGDDYFTLTNLNPNGVEIVFKKAGDLSFTYTYPSTDDWAGTDTAKTATLRVHVNAAGPTPTPTNGGNSGGDNNGGNGWPFSEEYCHAIGQFLWSDGFCHPTAPDEANAPVPDAPPVVDGHASGTLKKTGAETGAVWLFIILGLLGIASLGGYRYLKWKHRPQYLR